MPYRGGAGYWIAIAFLGFMAVLFGTLYFQRETKILDLENKLRTLSPNDLASEPWLNQQVRDLVANLEEMKEKEEKLRTATVVDLKNQLAATETKLREEERKCMEREAQLKERKADLEIKDKQVRDTQEEMTRRLNERNENLEAEITKYRNMVAESQQKITSLQGKNTALGQEIARLQAIARDRILQIQRENQGLREVIEKWSREAGRREQVKIEPYDGRIIQVDINNKFIVVDLGRQHRVHRGMRFDVIRWRLNKWDYMGQIELTKVDSTTSQGVILDAVVQQKICPLCGYVAKEPEEQVCPYCRGGASRERVVELVKGDVEEKPSMRKLDPIVVGDYITNPFYSKERQLRFVVAGEMLRYTPEEIKNQIKKFGGEVQERVDVDTDYLVLGQIPEESAVADRADSAEMRKRREIAVASLKTAKDYGIPIMREVELFEFLRY